jgi:acyl-coenzyme A thioesterase PaaI-like protein
VRADRAVTVLSPEELGRFLAAAFPDLDTKPFSVSSVSEREIVVRLRAATAHLRPGGTVSGPTLMLLVDTAAWLLLVARHGTGTIEAPSIAARSVTSSMSIHFLRRPLPGVLVATARLLQDGRRLSVTDVIVAAEGEERPVVQATVTYSKPDA